MPTLSCSRCTAPLAPSDRVEVVEPGGARIQVHQGCLRDGDFGPSLLRQIPCGACSYPVTDRKHKHSGVYFCSSHCLQRADHADHADLLAAAQATCLRCGRPSDLGVPTYSGAGFCCRTCRDEFKREMYAEMYGGPLSQSLSGIPNWKEAAGRFIGEDAAFTDTIDALYRAMRVPTEFLLPEGESTKGLKEVTKHEHEREPPAELEMRIGANISTNISPKEQLIERGGELYRPVSRDEASEPTDYHPGLASNGSRVPQTYRPIGRTTCVGNTAYDSGVLFRWLTFTEPVHLSDYVMLSDGTMMLIGTEQLLKEGARAYRAVSLPAPGTRPVMWHPPEQTKLSEQLHAFGSDLCGHHLLQGDDLSLFRRLGTNETSQAGDRRLILSFSRHTSWEAAAVNQRVGEEIVYRRAVIRRLDGVEYRYLDKGEVLMFSDYQLPPEDVVLQDPAAAAYGCHIEADLRYVRRIQRPAGALAADGPQVRSRFRTGSWPVVDHAAAGRAIARSRHTDDFVRAPIAPDPHTAHRLDLEARGVEHGATRLEPGRAEVTVHMAEQYGCEFE